MNFSVRRACKFFFPWIDHTTILLWIKKSFFSPYSRADRETRPNVGTELDIADLIVVGILHRLFTFGLKYQDIEKGLKLSFDNGDRGIRKVKLYNSGRTMQDYLGHYKFKVFVFWAPEPQQATEIIFYPMSELSSHMGYLSKIMPSRPEEESKPLALGYVWIDCESIARDVIGTHNDIVGDFEMDI
jgi:hypothetical protein